MIDWLLRDRKSGKLVIFQIPNIPLWIFIAATVVRFVVRPSGDVATALDVIATLALGWWAIDEILRGVNPFRRMLGALVLAVIIVGLLMR